MIKRYLKSGVMENGVVTETEEAWSEKKEGFYTTGTMTVVYIIDRINGEGYVLIENIVFLLLNQKLVDTIYDTIL